MSVLGFIKISLLSRRRKESRQFGAGHGNYDTSKCKTLAWCKKKSHIAVEVPEENTENEWLEPVSDEECESLEKEMI